MHQVITSFGRSEEVEPVTPQDFVTGPAGQVKEVVVTEGNHAMTIEADGYQADGRKNITETTIRLLQSLLGAPPFGNLPGKLFIGLRQFRSALLDEFTDLEAQYGILPHKQFDGQFRG